MASVVCQKYELVVKGDSVRERFWFVVLTWGPPIQRANLTRLNVLNHDRAIRCTVGCPEFIAMGFRGRVLAPAKKDLTVAQNKTEIGSFELNVRLHHYRSGGCAVSFPQPAIPDEQHS